MPGKPLSIAALLTLVGALHASLAAQLTPPSTGGVVALDFLLQRLAEERRVLVIGAHPDDEDTALLTLVARGFGAKVAYLSLCRGEGGQNLVGEELGVGLGILRTGELISARLVDGARQYFTRAYDFGFSKSLEETSRFWQPDSILKDVVRVVRRFKPQVMVTMFAGTPQDGHGQHQAAGVAARAAFQAAGDPGMFPELSYEEGLEAWTPLKLYQSAWFDPATATLELSTGAIESRSGRTYQQIAMASRSRHRSQDMGRIQPIGPASTRLRLVNDRTSTVAGNGGGDSLFSGIRADTSWLTSLADSIRGELSASRLWAAAEPLARAIVRGDASYGLSSARDLLGEALATSAGVLIDARSASATAVPGRPVDITVAVYNGGTFDVVVRDVEFDIPEGWLSSSVSESEDADTLKAGSMLERRFVVDVSSAEPPTQPYYLEHELEGGLYDWTGVPAEIRGVPLQPPGFRAVVELAILGAPVRLEREVTYRENDQAVGEIRSPVHVVPQLDIKIEPRRLVWRAGDVGTRTFSVTVVHNGDDSVSGFVGLEADLLPTPMALPFEFVRNGESATYQFDVGKPSGVTSMAAEIRAVARTEEGRIFDIGVETVSYPHIRPIPRVVEAVADVRIEPIGMPTSRTLGYVRGAADRIPEALTQFGLPLRLLSQTDLAKADLSEFDAIVIGSRAYETDTALVNHNDRLLSYVDGGGHLVVLYQQYQFAAGGYAPYAIDISRPHDRITDETAPVTVLEPEHPVFNHPNLINDEDWEGWPQERGLYFAGTWDGAYTPLLEMADPESDPVQGGLLVAKYGEGTYVYTGLSFFRAIPEGVVGAYRLFLNLIQLGEGAR